VYREIASPLALPLRGQRPTCASGSHECRIAASQTLQRREQPRDGAAAGVADGQPRAQGVVATQPHDDVLHGGRPGVLRRVPACLHCEARGTRLSNLPPLYTRSPQLCCSTPLETLPQQTRCTLQVPVRTAVLNQAACQRIQAAQTSASHSQSTLLGCAARGQGKCFTTHRHSNRFEPARPPNAMHGVGWR